MQTTSLRSVGTIVPELLGSSGPTSLERPAGSATPCRSKGTDGVVWGPECRVVLRTEADMLTTDVIANTTLRKREATVEFVSTSTQEQLSTYRAL